MEPIIIIGEAPAQTGDPDAVLEGAVGAKIAEFAGIGWPRYLVETERYNLLDRHVEPWPARDALIRAQSLWPTLRGRRTILLGQRVAKAFSLKLDPLVWVEMLSGASSAEVALLPHPSTRNLWWNEAANRAAARRFLEATFSAVVR